MPTVRTYGTPQQSLRALPSARRQGAPGADAFGAGFGEAVADIGGRWGSLIARAERTRADQTAVLAAQNQLASWENERLYDPNQGALTVKGKDSQGLLDSVPGQFDQRVGEIAAGLANDGQRAEFNRFVASRRLSVDHTLRQHVYGEMQAVDKAETRAFSENMVNSAIAHAATPALVANDLAELEKATTEFAMRQGVGPEARNQMITEQRTAVHAGVIDRFLAEDKFGAAKAYFDEVKPQIAGDKLAAIERALEAGTLRGQAQQKSDEILRTATGLNEALEMVRSATADDAKLRDEVQTRVEHGFALRDRMVREKQESDLTEMFNLVEKGGIGAALKDQRWTALEGGSRSALRSYAKSLATGVGVKTDQREWYRLYTLATNEATRNDFAQMNLLTMRGKLSDSDFQEFAKLQGAVRKGDEREADRIFATQGEIDDVVNDALRGIGMDPTPPEVGSKGYDKAKTDRVLEFKSVVRRRLEAIKADHKPTVQEIDGVVKSMLTKTQTAGKGSWWNPFSSSTPERYAFETTVLATKIGELDASVRDTIRRELGARGLNASDQAVVAVYNERVKQARGAR